MKTNFHKLMLVAFLMASGYLNFAQVEVSHAGQQITVLNGTDLYIIGNLNILSGNNDRIANEGVIHVTDSIINYGNQKVFGSQPNTGQVEITNPFAAISGNDTTHFNQLIVNSGGELTLKNDIFLTDQLTLTNGNLHLNSNVVTLGSNAYLTNLENNTSRIYGVNGYVTTTRPLSIGNHTDIAGLGLGINVIGNLGASVTINRYHDTLESPTNGSIFRSYTFNPMNDGLVSDPTINYVDNAELNGMHVDSLRMYLSEDSGTSWEKLSSSNIGSNPLEATKQWTLSSSSVLTLAEDSCKTIPYVDILQDTIPICSGNDALLFADGAAGYKSVWSNGTINNDTAFVSTTGYHYITIYTTGGCENTDSVYVSTDELPTVNFSALPTCSGTTTTFNNTSSHISGNLSYEWHFNDINLEPNDTSSLENPTFDFSTSGTYPVQLIATSPGGCRDSLTKNYVVLPIPVADFYIDNSKCEDSVFTTVNFSNVTPNAGITYEWNFGDGSALSNDFEPTHIFTGDGTFNVQLIATSNGCKDTLVVSTEVNPVPNANFVLPTLICDNAVSTFTNTSTINTGTMTYEWTTPFSNSSTTDLSVAIAPAGTHNITLTATSDQGCPSSITQSISSLPAPIADVTVLDGCEGSPLVIYNNSTGPGALTHSWDFNGVGSSTDEVPTYTFSNDGFPYVNYTVTSSNGCFDSQNKYLMVGPKPVADFSWTDDCLGNSIVFTNNSYQIGGQVMLTYEWNFDNLNTSMLDNPSETFAFDGTYDVELIATDGFCSDTVVNTVTVFPLPIVNIGDTIKTCGASYDLDASNTGGSYLWNDGSTNQTLTASTDGTYYVEVTDANSCVNSDTVEVFLNTTLTLNLGPDFTACNNTTLDAGYPGASFLWGGGETTQNITVNTTGNYSVTVTDQNNCVGTDDINVTINNSTPFTLGADISSCDGNIETLTIPLTGGNYLWNDNSTNQDLIVNNSGTYIGTFTNAANCTSSDTVEVLFQSLPTVNLGADFSVCKDTTLTYNASNVDYLWSTGGTSASETLTTTNDYWLELTNQTTGCVNRDSIFITIYPNPIVDLGADIVLCAGGNVTLDAENAGSSYLWNNNTTNQTLTTSTAGTFTVTVTDANGCFNSDTIEVNNGGQMNVDLGSDRTICSNSSTILNTGYSGATYEWYNTSGQFSTDSVVSITNADTIWVNVTNTYGCSESDTIVITQAVQDLIASYWAKSEVFPGDSVKFVNLSYPKPYTSTWDFADGLISNDSCPTHPFFVPGDYDVILTVDNGNCTASKVKTITVLPIKAEGITNNPIVTDQDTLYNEIIGLNLYPNPNTGIFNVDIDLYSESNVELMLFNLYGQMIHKEQIVGKDISKQFSFEQLTPGVYFINVYLNKSNIKTVKFIVQ